MSARPADEEPRPTGAAVAYGEEPSPDDRRWVEAAAELTDQSSLARVTAGARATVTAVSIVGTLLTGLGLVSARTLLDAPAARGLALAAAGCALGAVLAGLLYLALRLEQVNVHDLLQVQRWYDRQFRRARLAVGASWLLVLAVLLGGVAAAVGLLRTPSAPSPAMTLQLVGTGSGRQLSAAVAVQGLAPGALVTVRVIGMPSGACPGTTVLQSRSRADAAGVVSTGATVQSLPCNDRYRLEVVRDGVGTTALAAP